MLFTSLDHTRDLLRVPFISMFISIQLYPKSLLADSSATAVTRADMAHPLPWVWLTCSLTLVLFISGCMQYVCSRNTAWLLSAVRGRATYYMSKDSRKIAHEMSVFFFAWSVVSCVAFSYSIITYSKKCAAPSYFLFQKGEHSLL